MHFQVFPDLDAVGASASLSSIVGALLMLVLIGAVLSLIVCGTMWAVSTASGNHQAAARGRVGTFVSSGAAILAGAGVGWMNFLIGIGTTL